MGPPKPPRTGGIRPTPLHSAAARGYSSGMDAIQPASAILFPGQGVGDASSRELVERLRPDLLALATELVGEDPFERMSEGTAYAQPAVYCASIAGYEQLGRPGAQYFAGHS